MRLPHLLLVLPLLVGAIARGGTSGSGFGTRITAQMPTLRLTGKVRAVRWTAVDGHTWTRPLPRPTPLSELQLQAPAGSWADLTLIFDGPAALTDGFTTRALALDALTVPLADPDATGPLHLDLDIADWTSADPEALTAAVQDAALAR